MALDPIAVALLMGSLFDRLNLRYAVGGAVASTILGEPRATHDLDVVVEIPLAALPSLIQELESAGFYVPHAASRTAVVERRSFNVVHVESLLKDEKGQAVIGLYVLLGGIVLFATIVGSLDQWNRRQRRRTHKG